MVDPVFHTYDDAPAGDAVNTVLAVVAVQYVPPPVTDTTGF